MGNDQREVPSTEHGSDFSVKSYAAMLVDILGQRKGLAGWSQLPEGDPRENEAFMRALRDSLGVRREIEQQVRKTFAEHERTFTFPRMKSDPRYSAIVDSMNSEAIQIQAFGDTIIAFVPLRTAQGHYNARGLLQLLAASAGTFIYSVLNRSPTRIVMDIGNATDAFSGELYGPLLVELDYAEKSIAKWMRILVGTNLKKLLDRISFPQHGYPPHFVAALGLFRDSVVDDPVDSRLIVDYLGPHMAEHYQSIGRNEIRDSLLRATREMKSSLVGQDEIVLKYKRLESYLEWTAWRDARGF